MLINRVPFLNVVERPCTILLIFPQKNRFVGVSSRIFSLERGQENKAKGTLINMDITAILLTQYKPGTNEVALNPMSHLPARVFYRVMLTVLLFQPFSVPASSQYEQITHGDQRIAVSYPASLNEAERKITHLWLQKVAGALMTVYGELPRDSFRISIERSSSRSSPVPWGQIERGKPTNVLLVINPELGYESLIGDWTAFHELSHLLIPYRGYGNIWFSEGLATYYQNIIQARSGLFDETKMWHKIAAGFERGRKQQRWNHFNLTEVSDNLGETRQYMRVHWSGVLYWLSADVELRKQHQGTLDNALKQLKDCCEWHSMSAQAIARKLDELAKVKVFVPLFEKYRESFRIPEYKSILTDLGVKQNTWTGGISLDDDAPLADIRRQVYRNKP